MKVLIRTLLILGSAIVAIQCQNREAPLSIDDSGGQLEAASVGRITALIVALYPSSLETNAKNSFKAIDRRMDAGDLRGARRLAFQFINSLLQRYDQGQLDNPNGASPPTTEEAMAALIAAILQFIGLTLGDIPPGAFTEDGAFGPCGPGGCVIVTGTEFAGVSIPPGALDQPAFIAISKFPNSPGPLPTELDQYPFFYEFKLVPEGDEQEGLPAATITANDGFNTDVDLALCVLDNPPNPLGAPPSVVPNLVLAHTDESGEDIELLPPGSSGFIDCTDANTASIRTGRWDDFLASLFRPFAPRLLYATPGPLGAQVSSFSPFGAVDTTGFGSPDSTFTTIDAEPDTVFEGDPDTLTATVTPAPLLFEEPTVYFIMDSVDTLGFAGTDGSGVAVLVVGTGSCPGCMPVGTRFVRADFTGTPSHEASSSAGVPVWVFGVGASIGPSGDRRR